MVAQIAVKQEELTHDLLVAREMIVHLDEYLRSDAERWDMGRPGMPLMTIGGCLMRLRRLFVLRTHLLEMDQAALIRAKNDFDAALKETVVRFEQRSYLELSARLREWTNYLRNLAHSTKISSDQELYANKVDTRVVIGELVGKLSEYPYRLDGRVPRDVAAVDRRLRLMWEPGPFVWAPIWQDAYPKGEYWWLYGRPKGTR
jgi:hypothetical protein